MSRRRTSPPDSLELLLDTLCNTFGGVLFISMLVVVLLQLSGRPAGDQSEPNASADAIEGRRSTLEALRSEIDALRKTLDGQPVVVDPGLAQAIRDRREEAKTWDRRHAELTRRRDQALLELGGREVAIRRTDEAVSEIAKSLEEAKKARISAEEDRVRERKSRTRTVQAPSVRDTHKTPIAIEVRYGRVYLLHEYDARNDRVGPNLDDYVVLDATPEGVAVRPNPAAGLAIRQDDGFRQALAKRFARFPSRLHYLDIIARTDSFEVFGDLRSALTELGYEVSILPANGDVPIHDRGGKGRGVQ